MGLLDAFKQYISDVMPGGLLNPEVGRYLDQTKQNIIAGHQRRDTVMRGLLANPMDSGLQKQAVAQGLDMAGMAPLGMTVWHGSPHKFDKFDMSKIGTGEGAQAYGHGLYMAESRGVANTYAQNLANENARLIKDGVGISADEARRKIADRIYTSTNGIGRYRADEIARSMVEGKLQGDDANHFARFVKSSDWDEIEKLAHINGLKASEEFSAIRPEPQLYKTDIPDEAVSRFLDWDKPLSQQSPEVQKALEAIAPSLHPSLKDQVLRSVRNQLTDYEKDWAPVTGAALYRQIGQKHGGAQVVKDAALTTPQSTVSELLQRHGIPGIRYLDGGSRSAGQGSSNFVAFDPEMIRILERNGVPSGVQPWRPGEYHGLLGGVR